MLYFLLFVALAAAQFADTNCGRLRCTESEMLSRNYAKGLGLGTFACNATFIFYNPGLTINQSFTIPVGFITRYNETNGAFTTKDSSGRILAEEFCDDKGGICIVDYEPLLAGLHTESFDISRGERGNAARYFQSYEKTTRKAIRRIQALVTKRKGENIAVNVFDENGEFFFTGAQSCTKVGK